MRSTASGTPQVCAHGPRHAAVLAAGESIELIERVIPDGFFFHFRGTCPRFLLKPGATGWDVSASGERSAVHAGHAGSARLADIDLEGMRQARRAGFEASWDAVHAVAAGASWEPFVEIRKRYPPQTDRYDESIEHAAVREWFAQATLQKLWEARCASDFTHAALDRMLLSRTDYVQHCARDLAFGPTEVVEDGRLYQMEDEQAFLARQDSNTLLTQVAVKC